MGIEELKNKIKTVEKHLAVVEEIAESQMYDWKVKNDAEALSLDIRKELQSLYALLGRKMIDI